MKRVGKKIRFSDKDIGVFCISLFLIISVFMIVGSVNQVIAEDLNPPKGFNINDFNTYPANLDYLSQALSFSNLPDSNVRKSLGEDFFTSFNNQWQSATPEKIISLWNSANYDQKRYLFGGIDSVGSNENKIKLFNSFNSDSNNRDKLFSDIWDNSINSETKKIDEASLLKTNSLLNEPQLKDAKNNFINYVLKKSATNKDLALEGFGNSNIELTNDGNLKLSDGRILKAESIISSASKIKLLDDGKTIEYTLDMSKGALTVKDSGDGQLTNKGYINSKGKVELEYPFGNGKETLSIETKTENGKTRNVYTFSGEGRSEKLEDRNGVRIPRYDSEGNIISTYFVRPADSSGAVSFSVGETGDLKNEGTSNLEISIPSDSYDYSNPDSTKDTLKASYTVGSGANIYFKSEDVSAEIFNAPKEKNIVIIGKDSAYISADSSVTIHSYDGSLANSINSLSEVHFYGPDNTEWIKTDFPGNSYARRNPLGMEGSIGAYSSNLPSDYFTPKNVNSPGGVSPLIPGMAASGPLPDPSASTSPGQIPSQGQLPSVDGSTFGPAPSGGSCGPGGCGGSTYGSSSGRSGIFPRLRAFFRRLFRRG